ncbi:MAG: hypothetical protein SGPRY_009741, partial [Prymnesium sp.]
QAAESGSSAQAARTLLSDDNDELPQRKQQQRKHVRVAEDSSSDGQAEDAQPCPTTTSTVQKKRK